MQGGSREVPVRLSEGSGGGAGGSGSGGARSYSVVVGSGILGTLGARMRNLFGKSETGSRAFLVADDKLPQLTIEMARDALRSSGRRVELATMTATEEDKSLESVERLTTHMAAARLERGEPVVALGGGIVGDVAGFAAAIYRRGVPVIQCPTTLLAMVDASVGGKTGVNLGVPKAGGAVQLKKNMLGAFHQPSLVMCDVATLSSLPDDELACGLAECVKHALIGPDWGDPPLLEWISSHAIDFRGRLNPEFAELVTRNVSIKAKVVEGDEREERLDGKGRMCLNMGHTIGHAIETMDVQAVVGGAPRAETGLKHGEAVALGLIAEVVCGEQLGVTRKGLAVELAALFDTLGLPTAVRGLPPVQVIASAMMDDKKVGGGRLRMAVPNGAGGCEIVNDLPDAAVLAGIQTIESKS
jgi:3-dehydroquinate synthase